MSPINLAIAAALFILLWLGWRWLMRTDTLNYDRCAESYEKIFTAYQAIIAQNYVTLKDWEKVRDAHWLARHFLPKEIEVFTRTWLEKTTEAELRHKNIGRFGHLDLGGSMSAKAKIVDKKLINNYTELDEKELIQWLKAQNPRTFYLNYLPMI